VVDASEEQDKLYCHIYQEGDGKKGGNNVASLLMKTLGAGILNILNDNSKGKELNVVFDNCPGQNKNHHVLWLVPYLVEKGYFHSVNFIFLVMGHTKNAADRRFNNLKKVYRASNIYSMEMLLEVCGRSPLVTVCRVEDGDFKEDYESFFQLFYERYNPILKWHLFSCQFPTSRTARLCVSMRESNLPEHRPKNVYVVKTNFLDFQNLPPGLFQQPPTFQEALKLRREMLFAPLNEADLLDVIPFKGVPEFKQVQMYKNFRQFLPPDYQDITCPRPSDDVLKRQKDDQKQRAQNKRRKITSHTTTEEEDQQVLEECHHHHHQPDGVIQSV
jgi:hypothetical protein